MHVLIVGLGSIARKHIDALRMIVPSVRFTAVRHSSSLTSGDTPYIHSLSSFSEIPQNGDDFDFAIISNPTYAHVNAINNLLSLRIPLFIEKPLSHTMDGVAHIASELAAKRILSYVACNLRFHPVIIRMKELLNSVSRINEVNVYCGSYLPAWRPGVDFRSTYSSDAAMGGGVHLDLIHEIDYTRYLFGDPKSSRGWVRSTSSLEVSSADYALYLLEYPRFIARIQLNYFRLEAKRSIEVVTDTGIFEADLINNRIVHDGSKVLFHDGSSLADTYRAQMQYFLDGIGKGEIYVNSFEYAAETLRMALSVDSLS